MHSKLPVKNNPTTVIYPNFKETELNNDSAIHYNGKPIVCWRLRDTCVLILQSMFCGLVSVNLTQT